jgi:hypothetical protein
MKHSKSVKRIVCSYLGINPIEHVFGMEIYVFEEEMDILEHEVFLYLRRHRNASKEIGRGLFGASNDELHKLALVYLIKFGLMVDYDEEN